MKSLKVKLVSIVSAFILALSLLIVGVWAVGEAQHINLSGSVNFTISDDTLYIKDIRVREQGDLTGQGTTIENFIPGFVNGDIDLDLGERTADTSFTLLFDVINTTTTEYKASTVSKIPNATLSVSGIIAGDGIAPSKITNSTPISGTIVMTVTVQSAGTVSLDGIVIVIEENTGYTVTIERSGYSGETFSYFVLIINGKNIGSTGFFGLPNTSSYDDVKTIEIKSTFGVTRAVGPPTAGGENIVLDFSTGEHYKITLNDNVGTGVITLTQDVTITAVCSA